MSALTRLLDSASAAAGSDGKLGTALGVGRQRISHWRHQREHVPDKHILAMARIAGQPPLATALEVYRERLGELAKTLAIGVVAIIASFATPHADARHVAAAGDNV
jgi:DNA-binding transcriptional regulator YdaS (Cro superfamily)